MEDKPGFITLDAAPANNITKTQDLPSKELKFKAKDNKEFILKIIMEQNNIIFQANINDDINVNTFIYKKVLLLKDFYESNKYLKI